MNDLETRLHSALRDAVPHPVVPPGLLGEASRRAVRIRRRRIATRGALGAAAVVATGAVAMQRPPSGAPGPALTAGPAAGASEAAQEPVTITIRRATCEMRQPEGPTVECVRTEVDFPRKGTDSLDVAVENGFGPDDAREGREWKDPHRVRVRFSDGTTRTVATRETADDVWSATVPPPEGADVLQVTLIAADGSEIITFEVRPGGDLATGDAEGGDREVIVYGEGSDSDVTVGITGSAGPAA